MLYAGSSTSATQDTLLASLKYLSESREHARQSVYTPEVLEAITDAMRGLTDRIELPKLSDAYFENAGALARIRAVEAGYRLSVVMAGGLKDRN